MGLATLVSGSLSGVSVVTIPQLLAARGVPELQIAALSGLSFLPGVFNMFVAPILDVGLSRRTWATLIGVALALLTALALNLLDNLPVLGVTLFVGNICYYLFTPAVAGWFGQLVRRDEEVALAGWLSTGSIGGFGLMSALAIVLLRGLPFGVGVFAVCTGSLAPLALFVFVPHEPTPTLAFRESFGPVARNVGRMVRNKHIWRMMALFALPCGTFSLTNTLSGVGTHDFHASEAFVGLVGGVGMTAGGVFGSLVAPRLARRFEPLALYIGIGVVGALFTLLLLFPARTPVLFAVAMVGENVFQSAATALTYALALLSTGKNNPTASTQFALIGCAYVAPIVYMPILDGLGYDRGGIAGNLATDAILGLLACALMVFLFARPWRETLRQEDVEAPDAVNAGGIAS